MYIFISFSPKNIVLFGPRTFLPFANCAVPDEMQRYAAFHLGHHCLQEYS